MCGIAGLIKLEHTDLDPKNVVMTLLSDIQARGTDAVGAAWEILGDERTYYNKQATRVNRFNPSIPDTAYVVLGHVRNATHGKPSNNENNHPVFGNRYIITHNGVVNPKKLASYKYRGETDTEVMLSYIEKDGWSGVPETPGNKSVAVWDMVEKELMLYTSSTSLYAIVHKGCLIWCSTDEPLKALRGEDASPIVMSLDVKKDTAYIIKPFKPKIEVTTYRISLHTAGAITTYVNDNDNYHSGYNSIGGYSNSYDGYMV